MRVKGIIGIDGHDGAGKTTLAKLLSAHLQASYIRPFGGIVGQNLMDAYEAGDHDRVLSVGESAIYQAIENADLNHLIVLDRAWLTVGSLVPKSLFLARWSLWTPSILCWSDLSTTLARLSIRQNEETEKREWHEHFLAVYFDLASKKNTQILRTDRADIDTNFDSLLTITHEILKEEGVLF